MCSNGSRPEHEGGGVEGGGGREKMINRGGGEDDKQGGGGRGEKMLNRAGVAILVQQHWNDNKKTNQRWSYLPTAAVTSLRCWWKMDGILLLSRKPR